MMRWFLAIALAVFARTTYAQSPCGPASTTRLASTARQIDAALLRENVKDMWTDVPTRIQRSIAYFKEALTAVADQSMRCAARGSSAAVLQSRLAGLLHANAPERPFNASDLESVGGYGTQVKVNVTTPANAPDVRMVIVSFGIQCGEDSVLLLYASEADGWRRLLRWQSKPYKEVSGAFGDFVVYGVMPSVGATPMRVVAAHGTPWCTSRFSGFDMDLLEPGADPGTPRVVWSMSRGYSRGDAETRLRVKDDTFELRLNVAAMNIESFETPVVFRYRVKGDSVTRIEPIARNGRGFVEEWLHMPWEEAKGQIATGTAENLKAVHDEFAKDYAEKNTYVERPYGPVRACGERQFQVQFDAERHTFVKDNTPWKDEPLPPTYFLIRETGDGYELEGTRHVADPRCKGPDLMPPKSQ